MQPQVRKADFSEEMDEDLLQAAQARPLGLQPAAAALDHHEMGIADALVDDVRAQLTLEHTLRMLVDEVPAGRPARPQSLGDAIQPDHVDLARGQGLGIAQPIQHLGQVGRIQSQDRRRRRGCRSGVERFGCFHDAGAVTAAILRRRALTAGGGSCFARANGKCRPTFADPVALPDGGQPG